MTRIIQNSFIAACLLVCNCLNAQSFKSRAMLGAVNKTGFYSIAVTPELSSYVKTDFSDVRVLDDNGKQAEYVVNCPGLTFLQDTSIYKTLAVVQDKQADSGKTIVIVENNLNEKINSLALLVANASISRMLDISGSNDKKKWFSIEENMNLEKRYVSDTDKYVETVRFPLVSYHYIKLIIYNGKNDPLNIISAGRYADFQFKFVNHLITNTTCSFTQVDSSDGYSYINIDDSLPFHIDRISLGITGPKFFKRDAEIIIPYVNSLNFSLLSNNSFNLDVPVFKSKQWLIRVYNGDNPPLKITGISTYQQEKNIITWLDSGKIYHLEMNSLSAVAPQYDLQNFKDSIPKNITPLQYSAIEGISVIGVSPNTSIFKQSWLWVVIILVLVVLVYFTLQLSKEVAKK